MSEYCEVEVNLEDKILDYDVLLEKVRDRDAILTLLTDRIDMRVVETANKAKIFANYAVGYDNIDLKAAREKGIHVTNTPNVLTDSTSDLA